MLSMVDTSYAKGVNQAVNPGGGSRLAPNRSNIDRITDSAGIEVWLSSAQAVNLLNVSKWAFHKARQSGRYTTRDTFGNGGKQYEVLLSSLPVEAQARYWESHLAPADEVVADVDADAKAYAEAADYSRTQADKYLSILTACEGLKGGKLKAFIAEWNARQPEHLHTSYPAVMRARKAYKESGVAGLLADYGKTKGNSSVKDEWFDYFKSVFLKETGPSLKSCWVQTLGFARKLDPSIVVDSFPSHEAFRRKLYASLPEDAIYLARHGFDSWNKKYGAAVDRDLSRVRAGEVWFSDHRQLDILLSLPSGKQARPWVTVWRDMRTSRWMGWFLHIEAPTADHVFQSFQQAAKTWGIPTRIYIDNGKDYRAKDFAGGRRSVTVNVEEERTRSLMALLGITVTFAKPYGAQSKTLERDFRDLAEWFDKNAPGYTGNNAVTRPQGLAQEVKRGGLMEWGDEFVCLFGTFVEDVLHEMPSAGKVLQGRSRNQAWKEEFEGLQRVSEDALKLYCMRVGGQKKIGRHGVTENRRENLYYWAEWMSAAKGVSVYMRRDPLAYQTAYVFRASNDEYLGTATLTAWKAAAIAETDLERADLEQMLRQKRADQRLAKAYAETLNSPSLSEKVSNMAEGARALSASDGEAPLPPNPKVVRLTPLDEVANEERRSKGTGTYPLDALVPTGTGGKSNIKLWEDENE